MSAQIPRTQIPRTPATRDLVPRRATAAALAAAARGRRRRWQVGLTLLCLALLVVGGKWASMAAFNHAGRAAIDRTDYAGAAEWFSANKVANWFEPWKPYFNTGVALYHQKNWDGAQGEFEQALGRVPLDHRCTVALNLAWTLEAKGDALIDRRDRLGAAAAFARAKAVAEDARCDKSKRAANSSGGSPTQQQEQTSERLKTKQNNASKPSDQDEGKDADEPSTEGQLKQLQQQNKNAQRQQRRKDDDSRGKGKGDSSGEPGW